jgi:hypothetical protein
MRPIIANSLWFASYLPQAAAYQQALRNVAGTQQRVLRRITGFHSVAEFQECVPFSAEPGTPSKPVIRLVPTSGTTGPTKLIPYTRSLLVEFQRGIAPWVVDLFRHEPRMLSGRSYWAISPVAGEAEHFDDDSAYLGGFARRLARSVQAVPATVRHVRDIDEWRRETLRHLAACRDLTLVSVWHPSFLISLLEPIREPAKLWPKLRVISCWADAAAERPAKELARLFPQATVQPKGLIATEGFVSLPLLGRDGAALAVRSHFFEFLDVVGKATLAHELVTGHEYSVVVTTSGGLLRYRLHDRVRVMGFEQECPLLRFIGKEALVSDHFGEKLNERHVCAAVEALRLDATFAMVACQDNAYTLIVETVESDERLLMAAEQLDAALQENVHYRYCRQLGQLAPLRVFRVMQNAQAGYLNGCHRRRVQIGAAKPLLLQRGSGWVDDFKGYWLTPRAQRPRRMPEAFPDYQHKGS